ncbi:MAG: DUF1592 domain-containing protein [Pirellulaceae bacterium]|nr:DUF1592 domain-containing protein [Pirellulaceae bacterium]
MVALTRFHNRLSDLAVVQCCVTVIVAILLSVGEPPPIRGADGEQSVAASSLGHENASPSNMSFDEDVRPLLEQWCVRCHNVDKRMSGIRLDHLDGQMASEQLFLWENVLEQLSEETMPPEDEPQPSTEQRQQLIHWIQTGMTAAQSQTAHKNGSVRRLTLAQYRNTIRDLLGIEEDVTNVLPPDAVSKDGFVNNSQTMSLSPLLLEAYIGIAERALDICMVDESSLPTVQNFRMDLGEAVNPEPFPEPLILGAFSVLLPNQDFMVTQLIPSKEFEFNPFRMQTVYDFIEGYQGNDTVRGWRRFTSVYHSVFACFRGSGGYPMGRAWESVPEGLLLRPAIPSEEIFGQSNTYGPRANFKIALRELPERGNFRVTVRAAKYNDALLLAPGEAAPAEESGNAITLQDLTSPTTVQVEQAGIYQLDAFIHSQIHKDRVAPDDSRLAQGLVGVWSLDGNATSQQGDKELVGEIQGSAHFNESPFGQSLSVDGQTGFVVVPHDETMNVGEGEFTVAAWIRPRQLKQSGIVCLGGYGYTHGWIFDLPRNDGVLRIETANWMGEHNGTVESVAGAIREGHWQHVAVVVRRGENGTRLYVNGYQVGEGTIGPANFNNPNVSLHIGRVQHSVFFNGEIDDVRLYRRALEVSELEALVEPGREFDTPPLADQKQDLTLTVGNCRFTNQWHQPAFAVMRLPAGPLDVQAQYGTQEALDRIVLTPLLDGYPVAQKFVRFEQRKPRVGVHVGLRRDCGSALSQVGDIQSVSSAELQELVFEGAINNFPDPDVEKNNVNYLAGVREIAVRSEYTDGREMPRLLVRSVEFEGPFYETWPPATHRNIFIESEHREDPTMYALEIIRSFATRAFRRPLTPQEEASLLAVWSTAFAEHGDFQKGVRDTLAIVLTSPQFLFLIEVSESPDPEPLDPYELASKLSYFLWNGPPDQQLLDLAGTATLRASLDEQVERMVAHPRLRHFAAEFVSQWLSLDKFDVVETDSEKFPKLTRDTKKALRQEPVRFVEYLIQQNLPLRNLVDSDLLLANEVVASYYDLADHTEDGFEYVALNHGKAELGGILTQACILAGLSDGREANPVKRGAWLARKIIAEPPDDPPPNVAQLEEDTSHLPLRQRLEAHRNQEGCAKCHEGIDPWGLPMEQYDAGGRFQAQATSSTRAILPDGTDVANLNELKAYLAKERLDQVTFSFLKHLTTYAIGRTLSYNEIEGLKKKMLKLRDSEYRMQDLVRLVVQSDMFLEK